MTTEADHYAPKALTATNLWRLAELLWAFHEAHDHQVHGHVMAVHTAVVTEAEAREIDPRTGRQRR